MTTATGVWTPVSTGQVTPSGGRDIEEELDIFVNQKPEKYEDEAITARRAWAEGQLKLLDDGEGTSAEHSDGLLQERLSCMYNTFVGMEGLADDFLKAAVLPLEKSVGSKEKQELGDHVTQKEKDTARNSIFKVIHDLRHGSIPFRGRDIKNGVEFARSIFYGHASDFGPYSGLSLGDELTYFKFMNLPITNSKIILASLRAHRDIHYMPQTDVSVIHHLFDCTCSDRSAMSTPRGSMQDDRHSIDPSFGPEVRVSPPEL